MTRCDCRGNQVFQAVITATIVAWLCFGPAAMADERLRVTLNDIVGDAGETGVIEVSLANPTDDIAAFDLHLIINRSDIANFQVASGSSGFEVTFDTVGTLISGWSSVSTEPVNTGGLGLDVLIRASADQPGFTNAIPPQAGDVLIRIPVDIKSIPDAQEDRTAVVAVDDMQPVYFVFSTPSGEAIGWTTEAVEDTSYFMCVVPGPPPDYVCFEWIKVYSWECPPEGCDSVGVNIVNVPVIDETQVTLIPGSITVDTWLCGDVNGDGTVSIGDISVIIDHLFINNPPIDPIAAGNVNCSLEQPVVLTIGDISTLVDHLFINGTDLCCLR